LLKNIFFNMTKKPVKQVVALKNYDPLKWDSKAVMAA